MHVKSIAKSAFFGLLMLQSCEFRFFVIFSKFQRFLPFVFRQSVDRFIFRLKLQLVILQIFHKNLEMQVSNFLNFGCKEKSTFVAKLILFYHLLLLAGNSFNKRKVFPFIFASKNRQNVNEDPSLK